MQLYLSSNKGERAGVPPSLPAGGASTHAAASAPAHAHAHMHRTEDPNTVLPPRVGIVNGGFWVCAQGSATKRQPESFHKPPRGRPLGGRGSAMTFWAAHAAYLSARGSVQACLQVCQHGAQSGTPARPYTHAGKPAHASHAEDISTVLSQGLGFMTCNIAVRSGNRIRSINRRGGHALGGRESAIPFVAEHAAHLTARGGARGRASIICRRAHKQAH